MSIVLGWTWLNVGEDDDFDVEWRWWSKVTLNNCWPANVLLKIILIVSVRYGDLKRVWSVSYILSIIVNLDRKSEDWFWENLQYSPLGAAVNGQRQAFLIVWSCFHGSAHLNFLSSCFQEAWEGFLKMPWFENKLFVGNILKILSYRFCPISNYLPFWFPHFD